MAQSRSLLKQVSGIDVAGDSGRFREDVSIGEPVSDAGACAHEDDWQLL